MLQAIDLTKRYEDGSLALDALNLHIEEGEIFFLLGANGAGSWTRNALTFVLTYNEQIINGESIRISEGIALTNGSNLVLF